MTGFAMRQRWHNLLFAHWPVAASTIQSLLPPSLTVDTYDGEAWVGVVPFRMSHIQFRGLPVIPLTNAFAELNVRTYVTVNGQPGVWFFSLDASNRGAVEVARRWFHLPYFYAGMVVETEGRTVRYSSHRTDARIGPGLFAGCYQPTSKIFHSTPGTLEHWLTERYLLYAVDREGNLFQGAIEHPPWPLQHAEAVFTANSVAAAHGILLPDTRPLLHYAHRLDVKAGFPQWVD